MGGFFRANQWNLCPTGSVRHRFWKQHSDAAHAGNCAETAARAPNSNFRDTRKQTFMKMFGGAALSKRLQLVRPAPGRHFEAASTEGTRQEGHQGCHRGPKSASQAHARARAARARARARARALRVQKKHKLLSNEQNGAETAARAPFSAHQRPLESQNALQPMLSRSHPWPPDGSPQPTPTLTERQTSKVALRASPQLGAQLAEPLKPGIRQH